MKRPIVFFIAACVLGGTVVGCKGLSLFATSRETTAPPTLPLLRFDHEQWLKHPEITSREGTRSRMQEDLVRRFLRRGLTKAQVRNAIGAPAREGDPRKTEDLRFRAEDATAWFYPMRSYEDDDMAMVYNLVILFDRNGRLTHVADDFEA